MRSLLNKACIQGSWNSWRRIALGLGWAELGWVSMGWDDLAGDSRGRSGGSALPLGARGARIKLVNTRLNLENSGHTYKARKKSVTATK